MSRKVRNRWGGIRNFTQLDSGATRRNDANRFAAHTNNDRARVGDAIEVRVSPDTIVEVYSIAGVPENEWDSAPQEVDANEWEDSRAAHIESQPTLADYWRARRTQRAAAYFLFAALATLVVWFVSR